MDKKKKSLIFLSLGIVFFLIITIGITYSFFNYFKEGTTDNSITTGGITFLYTETTGVGRGISINDALPISDSQGKLQTGEGKVFDFKVTSNTLKNTSIPYEVTARKTTNSTLDDSAVKLYLTEVNGTSETELLLDNYSNLRKASKVTDDSNVIEKIIYTDTVPAGTTNYEKNFRLRMWIDEEVDFSPVKDENGNDVYLYNDKTFTITVNVYANATTNNDTTSVKAPGLYDENGVMVASWDTLVNQYGLDVEKDYSNQTTDTQSFYYISQTYGLDGTLVIPEGIERIGNYALEGTYDTKILDGVVLPSTLKSIGDSALKFTNITSIEIPASVESIGTYALANNSSLTNIKVLANITEIPKFFADTTAVTSIGKIGSGADVEISDTVTVIGQQSFANNPITSIDLPNSVVNINDSAFLKHQASLIILPDGVETIGTGSFTTAVDNTVIYVPDSVTSISNYAFFNVKEVYYSGDATGSPWGAKSVNAIATFILSSSNYEMAGIESLSGDVVIPDSFTYEGTEYTTVGIDYATFNENNNITSVTLPDTIISIGDYAFNNAQNLKTINLPEGLQTIGRAAFQYTYSLEEITLPSTLKSLGQYAFNHSNSLNNTSIYIPASLEVIGHLYYPTHIFYNAGKDGVFTAFEIDSSNPNYQVIDGILYSKDGSILVAIPRGKTFTDNTYEMPDTITTLGELSFSRNLNIKKVIISDKLIINGYDVNDIPNYINSGNTLSLASYQYAPVSYYDVKSTNTNYKSVDGALYTIDGSTLVAIPPFYEGTLTIPEGVTTWQKEAMWTDTRATLVNKKITNISIPSTLTNIDSNGLSYVNGLITSGQVTVTISDDNPKYTIGSDNKIQEK